MGPDIPPGKSLDAIRTWAALLETGLFTVEGAYRIMLYHLGLVPCIIPFKPVTKPRKTYTRRRK